MSMLRRIAPTFQQPMRALLFHSSSRSLNQYPLDRNGKPLNAFMKFTKEKRADIVSANPEIKFTEISKKIGAMWKELSETERDSYKKAASEELEKFKALKDKI